MLTHPAIAAYVDQNRERLLAELLDLLRIPSISTLPEHRGDVLAAAEFTAAALRAAGMPHVEIIPTEGHPLVYAESLEAPGKPTVLCYGHYDVQPPDPLELWTSPPFEPRLAGGNIYARGAADDKGQFYTHVKAIETLRALGGGKLPVNVKFLIEGEEEIGGKSVARFVAENPEKLRADVALVSDTALYASGLPTLCIGLRGLVYLEIEATGPARDLHSGLYGGAAPNAVYGLVQLLAQAKDAQGVIQIPGIYDAVRPPAPEELESWESLPFDPAAYLAEVGSPSLTGEPGRSVFERTWARPTFEVHGIAGGFTGAGAKTVIPARAVAKVSLRLVPDQDPDQVIAALRAWVAAHTPEGITLAVRVLSGGPGLLVNPDHPAIAVAARCFAESLGQKTVFVRSGGSIPIVGDFAHHLGIPTILMGFGLPDDGLHSPNEKFAVANYYQGIVTVAHFLEQYGA